MRKRIAIVISMVAVLACLFALAVNAECTADHEGKWSLTFSDEGYLGEISATYTCTTCSGTKAEKIPALFETLGYSYGESGITQHYAVNRAAVARYEEITGEAVKFGAVVATKNNVDGNPLDETGAPVNEKVKAVDFTDTKYDIFDVMVNNIPEEYRGEVGIICCAYIVAGNSVTYIENGVEKNNARSLTHSEVAVKVDTAEVEKPEIDEYQFIDGVKYRRLTLEELGYTKHAYWFTTDSKTYNKLSVGSTTTHKKYFATRIFTKDELPNGTIIMTSNSWYYRPEGWVDGMLRNETSTNPAKRPGEVKTKTVVIDDSWWIDSSKKATFTSRAFNVTKGSEIAENVTAGDIYDYFMIYVPVATYEGSEKPPVSEEPSVPETPENPDVPVTPENPDVPVTPENPETPFDPTLDKEKQDWDADGVLKILCIGNSFSVDSMEYVYQVAKAAGVKEVVLGNLYIGGCSLATHLSNAKGDKGAYTYYTNTSGTWKSTGGYKISTAVKSDDWDFITIQQVSGNSGVADTYNDLAAILDIVEPLNPSARLAWHMTWAYHTNSSHADYSKYDKNQMTMYNAIINAVQTKVLTENRIEIVIPAGTAIQNARTSYYGDNFTRDGYHLNDFGRYIGSLTFVKALTGLSIDSITYKLDSMTNYNLKLAIDAVNKAVATPYAVTKSAYVSDPSAPEAPTFPDIPATGEAPEGYRLLTLEEMGWQESSYWNGKNFSHNSSDAFSNKYYGTTNTFTKENIPVGSVIILNTADGWQYRPDGWGGSGTRPGNVTTARVEVTESWWKGYTTRGFNLSKKNGEKINTYTPEEIYEVMKIYVPINSGVASQVTDDMCVSEVTVIDGKEYRALTKESMGLLKNRFYWSEKMYGLYTYDANDPMTPKFYATGLFDQSILVSGAKIYIADGWQYRPEGWVGTALNSNSARPANVSTQYVTIDSVWWGEFTARGFNISKTNMPDLGEDVTEDTIYDAFKIYIPVDKIIK